MAGLTSTTDNRLEYLRTTQQKRKAEQARLQTVGGFGAPKSGFTGEQDYRTSLNEESELARLEAETSGRPKPRSLVNYGAPSMRSARPGVGSHSLGGDDEEDPMDKALRQGLLTQEYQRGQVGMDEYVGDKAERAIEFARPKGERALNLGYTAANARQLGDIHRDEGFANAQAGADTFMDPRIKEARGQANQEQEALLTARYGHEADAAAKVRAAEIAAGAKTGAASITAGGGLNREAIRSLVRSRETQGLLNGKLDEGQTSQLEDLLWRQANSGQGGAEGAQALGPGRVDDISLNALIAGAQGNKTGRDQLDQYWTQLTPEQQQRVYEAMHQAGAGR